MFEKIGFIGCGNMGTAMLKGILASGKRKAEDIMISCRTKETLEKKKAELRNPIISAFCWGGEIERQCSAYRYRTAQAY